MDISISPKVEFATFDTNIILLSKQPKPVAKKIFMEVWQFHQMMSRFLVIRLLPHVSRQSNLSVNDTGDISVKHGDVEKLPVIYFKAEENNRKTQVGNSTMKAFRTVTFSNDVPYFQRTSDGSR